MKIKFHIPLPKGHRLRFPLWGIIVVVLLAGFGVGGKLAFNEYREKQEADQQKVAQFEKEQQKKRDDLARTFAEARKAEEAQHAKEAAERDKQIAEIEKSFTFSTPSCDKLQNRPNIKILSDDCAYQMRATKGKVSIAVVFVTDDPNNAESLRKIGVGKGATQDGFGYINEYLTREAKRHKTAGPTFTLDYFGPYKSTESLRDVYYRDNGHKWIEVLKATSEKNNVPEKNYDLVNYIYLDNPRGGGMAFPSDHRSFVGFSFYSGSGTFIHETLHLFGASDKYLQEDNVDKGCTNVGRGDASGQVNVTGELYDIMCVDAAPWERIINSVTAKEIGW